MPIPISVRKSPTDFRALTGVSEICLEATWCHGNICVLVATAKG